MPMAFRRKPLKKLNLAGVAGRFAWDEMRGMKTDGFRFWNYTLYNFTYACNITNSAIG